MANDRARTPGGTRRTTARERSTKTSTRAAGRTTRTRTPPSPDAIRGRAARAVTKRLAEAGVQAVALAMVDNAGVTRVKCVPLRRFEDAARFGIGLSTVFSVFLANDDITSSPGIEGPSGDLRLVPDPTATVALPSMPGWAWAPVDQLDQEGEVWPACGRSFLRRMVGELARHGLDLRSAFETEFFLGRRQPLPPLGEGLPSFGESEHEPAIPAHVGPGYSAIVLADHGDLALDLITTLEEQGTGAQQFHPEYSTGQFELSVPPGDGVEPADTAILVRQTIRSVARRHGLAASFAPVVAPGLVGNGCHVHYSLWDRDGANAFTGGRGPLGMTRKAEAFAAGVLAELPALTAITAPSMISYERLQPHHWAGAYTAWGPENREAALRFITGMVGSRDRATNMELKSIDASSNPYLVLGALVAAGIEGLERNLALPPPTEDDPDSIPERERERLGIRRLPGSLEEAIGQLEGSSVLRKAMGDLLFDAFLATRRAELGTYRDRDPADVARALRWRY